MGAEFEATVLRFGATRAVAVRGELDLATVEAFAAAVRRALGEHPEFLVLDLAGLEQISPEGARAIDDAGRHAAARHARVTIIPPPDSAGQMTASTIRQSAPATVQ
jgi:anti-anti-sigma regulatory factor